MNLSNGDAMHGMCVCGCVRPFPFYSARQNLFMHLCRKYNNKTALFIVEELQKLHFMGASYHAHGRTYYFQFYKKTSSCLRHICVEFFGRGRIYQKNMRASHKDSQSPVCGCVCLSAFVCVRVYV